MVARVQRDNLLGGVFGLAVAAQDAALLRAHHELGRDGRLKLERRGAVHVVVVVERHRVRGRRQVAHVPPQHLPVRRRRERIRARLGLQELDT